jgi:hypothetical protein
MLLEKPLIVPDVAQPDIGEGGLIGLDAGAELEKELAVGRAA